MISKDDYRWFVDRTLDQMVAIVTELGDERASQRPGPPSANSPYAIMTHCVGVMTSWGGHFVAGREVVRDREAEWRAGGPVSDLLAKVAEARRQLAEDLAQAETADPPRYSPAPADAVLPLGRTQGGALFHLYEELSQHLGQMEVTRDILVAQP